MNFEQYVRIEALAGGLGCTDRAFIKALRSRMPAEGRNRANREWRHNLIRAGLAYKRKGI